MELFPLYFFQLNSAPAEVEMTKLKLNLVEIKQNLTKYEINLAKVKFVLDFVKLGFICGRLS